MKTKLIRTVAACIAAGLIVAPHAMAQRQLGKKKGPTSKIYLAEAVGDSEIQNGEKIYAAKQATAFDAPGTVIETKAGAHNAFVYSNGTGMFVDENTRVEIDRFVQEPFKPDRNSPADAPFEPSISQSAVHVAHGAVGVCTSQLVSGSSMLYSTPEAAVNIRGGKVSIQANPSETVIDLLEGDVTVRGGSKDIGGQILRAGERAVVRATPSGQPSITISRIPPEAMQASDERVSVACNAKKTVTFEIIEKKAEEGLDAPPSASTPGSTPDAPPAADDSAGAGGTQEIVVKPTVPADPPINIVVSPDRLPGT
ncbi:MAG: FecR domain-containing protein [Opitutae bacterium]|nr:FecR domain-containing protein [Opitutae bacterium]